MSFFRDASVCSLSCSNGISEGGKTFVRTCLNGEWVGDLDDMECDGKIVTFLSYFCHAIVTHSVASVTIQTEKYTDNTQVKITITVARKHKYFVHSYKLCLCSLGVKNGLLLMSHLMSLLEMTQFSL